MSQALREYRDQRSSLSKEDYDEKLCNSTTLYVGNLSFYSTEEQVYELFSMCGEVKRVIMGLDRVRKTPCGFCFVEYYTREEATNALRYISGTKLDERIIRTDRDIGFIEGRQYGRGKSGGQIRDDYRMDYDDDRGGFGGGAIRVMERQGVSPMALGLATPTEGKIKEEEQQKDS